MNSDERAALIAATRRQALDDAMAACARQTVLASMVATRPTDFEKGILSCSAAIQALRDE